jgi:UDP-N-acetylglucosamine 2-epimerase (non-hydrolysing)
MLVDLIAGARPNFMKIAPIIKAINKKGFKNNLISYRLVHTGQHFDKNMSDSFFEELGLPEPDVNLGAGGGTQAEQTAKIMMSSPSDLCLVVGDVTSTMACAIVAKKLNIKVAHVEGGIRSGDLSMPEEINRLVTDSITDYFFTTSEMANENLRKSGIAENKIHFVGNTMIDTLLANKSRFLKPDIWDEAGLKPGAYLVMTLHRPANVDQEENLKFLIDELVKASKGMKIVFPVHPRTKQVLNKMTIHADQLILIEPQSYLRFNYLVQYAKAVITDSGGITEETTVFGIPCMTLRANTERPETVSIGTNVLLGIHPESISPALEKLFSDQWKKGAIPPLWDGHAATRIVSILESLAM